MLIVRLRDGQNEIEELTDFIKLQDREFPVPISQKTDIGSYAGKLLHSGYVLAARDQEGLIQGMIAGYANDYETCEAYESVFVVDQAFRGTGLARSLFMEQKKICIAAGMERLVVKTHKSNEKAKAFYRKFGHAKITDLGDVYRYEWMLMDLR